MKFSLLRGSDLDAFEKEHPAAYMWLVRRTLARELEELRWKASFARSNCWEDERLAELEKWAIDTNNVDFVAELPC